MHAGGDLRLKENSAYDYLPAWDGREETLDDYAELVKDIVMGTKAEDRVLLGPRLRSRLPLNSTARRHARSVPDATLQGADGAMALVAAFRLAVQSRPMTTFQEEYEKMLPPLKSGKGSTSRRSATGRAGLRKTR